MRVLAVDFGSKMIGLAVGESDHGITTERAPIKASGTLKSDAEKLVDFARREQAEAIVVGIPENEPDRSQRMANVCNQLAERIRELGFAVFTVDEALTSAESERNLSAVSKQSRKRLVHGEAARLILERFFNGEA